MTVTSPTALLQLLLSGYDDLKSWPARRLDSAYTSPREKHRRIGILFFAACGLVLAVLMLPVPSCAASRAEERNGASERLASPIKFDIPSLPLALALDAYSAAGGVQVLYDSDLAAGHRSSRLYGLFTPVAALETILAGTGLVAQYTGQNNVAIVLVSTEEAARRSMPPVDAPVLFLDTLHVGPEIGQSGNHPDFRRYSSIVEADVRKIFDRNAKTLSGSYKVGVGLWVDASGAVLRSEIFRSTGDQDRDAAISQTLSQLAIGQAPPTGMPQPVKIVIVAHRL
jgi:hypothetical protein